MELAATSFAFPSVSSYVYYLLLDCIFISLLGLLDVVTRNYSKFSFSFAESHKRQARNDKYASTLPVQHPDGSHCFTSGCL